MPTGIYERTESAKLAISKYPVLLDHPTRIGERLDSQAWMDSLGNIEYEEEMRPLTKREKGKP